MAVRNHRAEQQRQKQPRAARARRAPSAAGPELEILRRAADQPQQAAPGALLGLQQRFGNRAVSRLLAGRSALPGGVQAKLHVGPANDVYEQQADALAAQVMRLPGGSPAAPLGDDGTAQRAPNLGAAVRRSAPADGGGFEPGSEFERQLQARQGGGAPLPGGVRDFMETRFGASFDNVRVHADSQANELASSIQARAFTHGRDIYMGAGQYSPDSPAGRELIAHELTHTIQQGATPANGQVSRAPQGIQRKQLNANDILGALDAIPFVKAKLDQKLNLGRGAQRDAAAAPMRTQVQAVLQQYEGQLAGGDATANQAMRLAAALEAVARTIAVNELNDPALTPLLAVKFLELYRSEIEAGLSQMDSAQDTLQLAQALVADDPVTLYMHGELHLDEAARRVRQAAFVANRQPDVMFKLLRQRFDMQMAALTRTGIDQSRDKSDTYSVREATGEVSLEYFKRVFGDVEQAAWKTDKAGNKRLKYTKESKQRLVALQTAVTAAHSPASGVVDQRPGLSYKQSKHLSEIEQREAGINLGTLDAQVDAALEAMLKVSGAEATQIRQQVQAGLANLPITITVSGAGWFGKRAPRRKYDEAKYKAGSSRRDEASYAELFDRPEAEGGVKHLGEYEDPATSNQKRGKNYLRFRNWKDNLMTGGLRFSDQELPVFGAVNVNWDAYSSQSTQAKDYGVNAYGDTHFVLRKANILDRLVYTATDHGMPRRNIYLAFADFVLGGMGVTGLKDVGRSNIVKHVINSIITNNPVAVTTQPFEVQIFGQVDITRDVEKIVVAPSVGEKVRKHITKFARKAPGLTVQFLAQPAEAVVSEGWFVPMPGDKGNNLVKQVQDEITTLP